MTNILDYLRWRGDLSFEQDVLNDVDGLILCRLAYLPFEEVVTEDFAALQPAVESMVNDLKSQVIVQTL